MNRIEDCISFLVGKAAQATSRRARELLAPHGVTPAQYAVLKVLAEQDGSTLTHLAGRLVLDSATTTGLADRLELASLVVRRADGKDRRVSRLFLTERGRGLGPPLDAAMDRLNAEVAARMGSDAAVLLAALRRLGETRS
jgi:DNA-binding MarR family transcriptional regulator